MDRRRAALRPRRRRRLAHRLRARVRADGRTIVMRSRRLLHRAPRARRAAGAAPPSPSAQTIAITGGEDSSGVGAGDRERDRRHHRRHDHRGRRQRARAGRRASRRRHGQVGDARPDQRRDVSSAWSRSAPNRRPTTTRPAGRSRRGRGIPRVGRAQPGSVLWAPARNEGITSVVTLPNGALVSGQAAFVDTSGGTRTDMVRRGAGGDGRAARRRRRPPRRGARGRS